MGNRESRRAKQRAPQKTQQAPQRLINKRVEDLADNSMIKAQAAILGIVTILIAGAFLVSLVQTY